MQRRSCHTLDQAISSVGVRRTATGHRTGTSHATTTDMSDSETAPAEAPVPAACTNIKADLDKCVAEKGAEGCKDLLEAFAASVNVHFQSFMFPAFPSAQQHWIQQQQ
ncbi:hypothetical protein OJAV_G00073490 [Oryzias javanicus]|uniref:Uncharacterized protein n=1 Tax=Oryzias javanicus TaxID=123683 RepID=A0A437D1Q4_ORYJA|nr:hypothetical protein OJAV_G00073490 [Oryzias javanicus]